MCELALEGVQIVDLDHPRGLGRRHRGADVVRPGLRPSVLVERDERLVDGPVVAPVVHQDLGPAGDLAGEPDREPVGVGGGERELPDRQAEAARELLGAGDRVLGGQHERRALAHLVADRLGGRGRRVPGHRAGVAEAQVDVLDSVDVGEAGAGRLGDEDRERARPLDHPVHRHTGQERAPGALVQRLRAWVQLDEPGLLAGLQGGQPAAVHGRPGHGRCVLWAFTFRVSCLIGAGGGAVDRGVRSGEVRCPRPGHACVPGLQAAQLSNE